MALILDLCGGTGAWSEPYRAAGYEVKIIDPVADHDPMLVEDYEFHCQLNGWPDVRGVLAAPPCTEFSGAGAWKWVEKDRDQPWLLQNALSIVYSCLNIIRETEPAWWVVENPVGRLRRLCPELNEHFAGSFHPHNYAGYEGGGNDLYTKKTQLFGRFNWPPFKNIEPTQGSKTLDYSPSPRRQAPRSITPAGFARAFFEANP